jgi:hypothetical protein
VLPQRTPEASKLEQLLTHLFALAAHQLASMHTAIATANTSEVIDA